VIFDVIRKLVLEKGTHGVDSLPSRGNIQGLMSKNEAGQPAAIKDT
jgi:hypothetical protein